MNRKILLGFFIMMMMAVTEASAVVRYVKENPSGRADGSSWANASDELQEMIAISGSGDEVWVAQGYYSPTYVIGDAGNDNRTLLLKPGVSVYGGFRGTEKLLSERDSGKYASRLSTYGSSHVVIAINTSSQSIVLDGFTIENGNAGGLEAPAVINGISVPYFSGGGVYASNSGSGSITLSNNYITFCSARRNGGGVYAEAKSGKIILRNNDLGYNNTQNSPNSYSTDQFGGGIYALTTSANAEIQLIGNLFRGNGTYDYNRYTPKGGGVYARTETGKISLINNTLSDNYALSGAGIYADTEAGGSVAIYNSIVQSNVAPDRNSPYRKDNIDGIVGAGILTIDYNYLGETPLPTGATDQGNNIYSAEDPFLYNSADMFESYQYQLGYTSPCINKGNNSWVGENDKDLAGFARKSDGHVDIGAFECQLPSSTTSRLYVSKKSETTGYSGSGDNWGNAILELSAALKYAGTHPEIKEIWVAAGYKERDYFSYYYNEPLYQAGNTDDGKDRAFILPPGIKLYGGFLGGETDLSQRERGIYTKLGSSYTYSFYHIVIALNTSDNQSILMDGFEIASGGYTVAANAADVTVNGISVPRSSGGGIYAYNSGNGSIILQNNYINGCQAVKNGGGIYAEAAKGSIVLRNNDFSSNNIASFTTTFNRSGGGIYALTTSANAEIQLSGNLFRNNGSSSYYNYYNYQTYKGGGVYARAEAGKIGLINNTLSKNYALEGAGIYVDTETAGQVDIYNNIVWSNFIPQINNSPVEGRNIDGNLNGALHLEYNYLGATSLPTTIINGGHNIVGEKDPFFAGEYNVYYQLGYDSPCVDKGDDSRVGGYDTDMAGFARISGSKVDIGAFEYQTLLPDVTRLYVNNNSENYYSNGQRQYYGNGNRWEEALAEFADALKYAESHPTITEIWVASGYYKPLYSINDSQDERDRSFVLPPGVSVYGGFSGNETNKEQRTKSNLTQLSSVNSIIYPYHVVVAVNNKPDKPIVFDGFNIQSGLADGEGFVSVEGREVSRSYGGGIYAYATGVNTKITLSGNTVSNNQADSIGGGVYAYANAGAQIALDENSIANNQADSLGGGVYAYAGENAVLQLRNNQIGSNNYYDSYYSSYSQIVQKSTKGGGVYAYAGEAGSTINLSNNTITTNNSFNFTYSYGSAAIDISASSFGGGVYALTAGAAAKITLSGNHISTNGNTTISLYDTEVNGSRSLKGGGIYASAGNNSQIKIDKNTIIDNSHHSSYGDKVHVDIISSGGGIYTEGLGVLSLDNNLIVRNDATIAGGGIYADGKATLSGNTIVRNTSTGKGAGIYADGNPLVYNSIVWNNEKEEGVTDNINKETGSSLTVSYSYVGDNAANVLPEVSTGAGNILNPDSPGFINADDINYEYDYRLSAGSLCIDKGSNAFADPNGADLYGSPRISGGVVDMGAIERLRLTPSGEKRLYVNKSASGDGSGTNWVNAVPELAIALAYAVENPDEVREVWVAAGTYTPTISPTASASNRFFLLSSDISVYGGFTGTESNLEDRNPAANETILSGKLGEHEGAADHVVVAVGNKADSQIILDGFTITGGGNNDGNYYYGGGFYVGYQVGGAFVQSYSGGGVYLATLEQGVSFMISGNKITGNHTLGEGGGIFVDPGYYRTGNADSTVIRIEANEISNNQTTSNGGGVHVAYNRFSFTQALPVVHIEANKISNNQATYDGGGIYVENENYGNNHIYISSNLINENNAGTSGGGAYLSGPLLASGNTVVNNKANYSAGGVLANSETTAVSNSIIWGNTANYYNNYYTQANNKTLTYSYLGDFAESNSYYIGENTITDSADPGFTNYAQGDYSLSANSICIDKGNNSRAVPGSRIDLAGAPRIAGGRIDMGAYERELSPVSPVDRIYVNKQASGNGSGDSWQNAFTELVDALKYTEEYQKQTGLIEVWVAKGVYHPLYILGQGRTSRTFLLVPGVGVYGGFDGTETDLASRNPAKNETILSGDIKNDDTGDIHSGFTNRSDNSDHTVIAANNSDQAIVLDGLTITGGGSDNSSSSYIYTNGYTVPPYYGAGIYALSEVGDITINDLKITGNNALENGGGVYAQMSGGTFTINTTAITGNTSSYYAGIYASVSNPDAHFIVSNSLVSDNASYAYSVNFQSENKGKITLSGVTISNNKSIGSNAASGVSIYSDNVDPDAIDVNIYNSIIWDKEAANNNSYGVWHMDYNYLSEDPNNGDIVFGAHNKINTKNPFKNQETGDYRLGRSICVDAGSNGYALGTTDITGAPRIYNNNVDMGAYEFDGSYDLDDFIIWTGNIDTDWDTADNWNTKEIPDATSSVYIPGGLHTYPILTAAGNAAVKDVRFGPGAEIGRQDLLAYEKAFVQLDFSTNGLDRNRWYMLANPLQELYAGDFSFGGYPGMDMKLFKTEQGQINKTVWNRIDSLTQSFSAGDGFIVWLASNRQENKGLKLSNGILELPYFDNDNVSADVHWTHTYDAVAEASSFGGWKEENGSIVANGTPKTAPRDLGKAYQLAGQIVEKSLDAGTDLFAIAGNPYMSSIDFTELQNANNTLIKGTYQIWIGPGGSLGGSYAGYNVSTGAFGREGVNLNSYIAPMQSFIVEKLDGNATTALAFDLAAIGVNGVSPGLRSAAPQGDKLAIVASTAQAGVRTVIASRQEGGDSFGPTDSRKLFDEINSIPDVYTLKPVANNEQVATAVNVLGENTGETLVPLAIATTHKGELTFTFSGMDTYNARIFLLDTETNTETELTGKAQYEYKFNYVPEQSGGKTVANESRFFIRLHKVATGVDAIASEAVRIYASRPGTLQVVSTHPLHQVMVYNLQGSKVYDAQVQTNTHKVEGLVGGVYLVKVVSGNTVKMEKVIVRN